MRERWRCTSLTRYLATKSSLRKKYTLCYLATSLQKVLSKKIYPLATSLLRFKNFSPKKYTPPLHRYFATSLQKVLSKKIYPPATSLLRYFASKSSLRKNIPPLRCFLHLSYLSSEQLVCNDFIDILCYLLSKFFDLLTMFPFIFLLIFYILLYFLCTFQFIFSFDTQFMFVFAFSLQAPPQPLVPVPG